MKQKTFLSAPEFAYHSKYEQTLTEVAKALEVKLPEVSWSFSKPDNTILEGSLLLPGEAGRRWLPKLSIHLELSEVRIMYTFWLSAILKERLDRSGATCIRGLKSILTFGAHVGLTVEEVLQEAPTYIEWAIDEIERFELDKEAAEALEKAKWDLRII
jgi:hypothetical protein